MGQPGINREACFWTTTTPGYNAMDRERWVVVDGKRVKEKFPQRGHLGDYEDRRAAPGVRDMLVVRDDGNTVRVVLTNAAAHLDIATPYAQYVRGKGHSCGWYNPGQCPCALIATGDMRADMAISPEVKNGTPCTHGSYSVKNPCRHSIAEKAARIALRRIETDEREASFKSKEDKILDAMREQTAALVDVSRRPKSTKGE